MKKPIYLIIFYCLLSVLAKAQNSDTATNKKATKLTEHKSQLIPNENSIYAAVSGPPQFPGGEDSLHRYLKKNIIYPNDIKNHMGAHVILSFVIEINGTLSNIKALVSPGPEFSNEAIRVMQPVRYIGGTQNNYPVRVQYTMAILFDPSKP
jgi:hypothetical protein